MTLRTLNYGNYGIFLIMGNAGFCPSTVVFLLMYTASSTGHYMGLHGFVGLLKPDLTEYTHRSQLPLRSFT